MRPHRTQLYACLLLAFVLAAIAADQPALTGKVVSVHDGDTLTLLVDRTQYKIRLDGIDAPELGQDFGTRAKQALSKACFGKVVKVETHGQDRYGHTLGEVFNGESINRRLVRDGMAWHYVKLPRSQSWPLGRSRRHSALGISSEEKAAGARRWRALTEHFKQRPPQFDVQILQDDETRAALQAG